MISAIVLVRALHFWATAVLVGGAGLSALMRAQRPRGEVPLLRIASIGAGVSGLAWLAATVTSVTGSDDALLHIGDWVAFLTSPFGPPWAILAALSLAACGFAVARAPTFFLALGVALTVDQAWLGHAASASGADSAAAIAAYVMHVLAGYAWVGALVMLCLCLRAPDALRDGLLSVSNLGLVVVALIAASGCVNAARHIEGIADLTGSAYGRVLLAKVALVAVMLVFAAFNRRTRAVQPPEKPRGLAVRVVIETLVGLVVLSLAAVLGITEPPA